MTNYNKTSLKTFFETGDVPDGTDYANLIDSNVNLVETANQVMAGALEATEFIAARVSAANMSITGTSTLVSVMATQIDTTTLNATTVSATTINSVGNISTSAARVIASAGQFENGYYVGTAIISAAGTTQGAGALLTAVINIGAGVADGATTGFLLRNNRAGHIQYITNGGASANLWPASECKINVLATNAAFGMAANTPYVIIHTTNSAYAVK